MKPVRPIGWLFVILLGTCLVLSSGCKIQGPDREVDELQNPMMKGAREKLKEGDIDGAIKLYREATEMTPPMARPHFDLATIYDEYKHDYIRAIYHYSRYMEMHPESDKKEMLEKLISDAKIAFATESTTKMLMDARTEQLQKDNQSLRSQVYELQNKLEHAEADLYSLRQELKKTEQALQEKIIAQKPGIEPKPQPPAQKEQEKRLPKNGEYRVQERDTLISIASEVYGNPDKWEIIYEANKDKIKNPNVLRPNQILIIPKH
ncbi:MAG: LysM peptidoglycan-binding domain-containing protein [Lentisphaerae bacterium]|nr:LysM peptidoglycan-binding domain-containing protein [Lentisphaerota bacterium]